jgi:hypothetical protein
MQERKRNIIERKQNLVGRNNPVTTKPEINGLRIFKHFLLLPDAQ